MKRTFWTLGTVSVASLIVLSFQNCAQPGDVSKVQGDSLANAMEIVPVVSMGIDLPSNNSLPTQSEDTLPSAIVSGMPGQPNSNPSGPTPQNNVVSTLPPDHSTHGDSDHTTSDDITSNDSTSDDSTSDDTVVSSEKVESCRSMKHAISDFKLNVSSIDVSQPNGNNIRIETLDSSISSASNQLEIKVNQNLSLDKLNIVLNQNGNQLLFKDGSFADLRTPSAQQSGIKVHLSSKISLEAGKNYILTLDFDLNDQIVASGKKCLFRPVIQTGKITIITQAL